MKKWFVGNFDIPLNMTFYREKKKQRMMEHLDRLKELDEDIKRLKNN